MWSGCAAVGAQGQAEGRSKHEIVAGSSHSGDPAVLYLIYPGGGVCTGTLIAPRAVLTARHCVEPDRPTAVGSGASVSSGRQYARVRDVRTTTGALTDGNDIAVLLLDRAGTLTPYSWNASGAPSTGARVVGIGYGRTSSSASDAGSKRRGESRIGPVQSDHFSTNGALACNGDSGGPAFDSSGKVIGVAVSVTGPAGSECAGGVTNYARPDAHRTLIEGAITASGSGTSSGGGSCGSGGTCGDVRTHTCSGRFVSGLCPGGAEIRCCEGTLTAVMSSPPGPGGTPGGSPTPAPGSECQSRGGQCADNRSNRCSTGFSGGLCPGGAEIQCCFGALTASGSAPSSPTPTPSPAPSGAMCTDTCTWAGDGECDDGRPGAITGVCPLGSDCMDCGPVGAGSAAASSGGTTCMDTCPWAGDGVCDDGASGSETSVCAAGTDCADCGPR